MNRSSSPRYSNAIPWFVRLADRWVRSGWPAGHRSVELLSRLGLLNRSCPHTTPAGGKFWISLDTAGLIGSDFFVQYERRALDAFAMAVDEMEVPPILIDCGAETGLYTRLLLERTTRFNRIVAIEPNPRAVSMLELNFGQISVAYEILEMGAGDRRMIGSLTLPEYDRKEASLFLTANSEGDVIVAPLDELVDERNLPVALKVDVEGAELEVLYGAEEVLRTAPSFVVQFEAHGSIWQRTGVCPFECLRFLQSIRDIRWSVFDERQDTEIDIMSMERPFFQQLPPDRFFDVVARSI